MFFSSLLYELVLIYETVWSCCLCPQTAGPLFLLFHGASYQIPWSIMALTAAFLINARLAARSSSLTSMSW